MTVLHAFLSGKNCLIRCFVAVIRGTGLRMIHAYTAYQRALTTGFCDGGQEVCGGYVDCGEVGGCCCAVGEGAGDHPVVDF